MTKAIEHSITFAPWGSRNYETDLMHPNSSSKGFPIVSKVDINFPLNIIFDSIEFF
jgi:hypothetical protein